MGRAAAGGGDEEAAALDGRGEHALDAGDLADARASFEQAVAIRRRLASEKPASIEAQIDLSRSLENLGDTMVQIGDLPAARTDRALLEEALELTRALQSSGRLAPADHWLLEQIPRTLAALPAPD